MYHSITFGDKNTWDDWHLIPSSRPVVKPPAFREKYVDIPGAEGSLDLSTLFTIEPTFSNRVGTFEFVVVNDYWNWEVAYETIMTYMHGKNMQMVLEDDPDFYYEGFFFVSDWVSGKSMSAIKIDYLVSPYKKEMFSSAEDWEWDPFDFETGVIRDYRNLVVSGTDSLTVELIGAPKTASLTFTSDAILSFRIGSTIYGLNVGTTVVPGLVIAEGVNTLIFSGTGTVTINYRGGSL